MIVHVHRRAVEAGIGPVRVVTDAPEIVAAVESAGGVAVITRSAHQSGSDRVWEAVKILDPAGTYGVVVNLQGDLPKIDPQLLKSSLLALSDPAVSIGTLVARSLDPREKDDPNIVKMVGVPIGPQRYRALYFTRSPVPWGDGDCLRHIGIYAYRRRALERFAALQPSPLELRERLEQLRAVEDGLRIDATVVERAPRSVDTFADLEALRSQES
jgi:3-deoxy-manno-octulosonate cytidylyltransferase (CMP-KDO synthetase)